MKRIIYPLVFFLVFGASLSFSSTSPEEMLKSTANTILSVLDTHQSELKQQPSIVYRAVEAHLLPHVDVSGMSRSVLGRQAWMKATSSERDAFSKAFTQLVIRTYATPLSEYTREKIRFLPMRGSLSDRFARVNSVIERPQGPPIPVSYSLVQKNGDWKIYDLSVEGVSLIQSFRTQFAEILRNKNMAGLIQEMQNKSRATS